MTKPKPPEEHGQKGAPSKYKAAYNKGVVAFMRKGFSATAYAATIGVHRDSIYEWAKTYPDFSDALKTACALCCLYWEKLLLKIATGGKGNLTAVIFALKNRGREEWAERISTEMRDKDGKPLDPDKDPFTALEVARRMAFMLTLGDRALLPGSEPPTQH